jgi:hypothetical protein
LFEAENYYPVENLEMHSKVAMGYAQLLAGQDFVKRINWPCWFIDGDLHKMAKTCSKQTN